MEMDVECPNCKQRNRTDFDQWYNCPNCEFINNRPKNRIDEKVLRQDITLSTRLPYESKKKREICFSMVTTKYETTKEKI